MVFQLHSLVGILVFFFFFGFSFFLVKMRITRVPVLLGACTSLNCSRHILTQSVQAVINIIYSFLPPIFCSLCSLSNHLIVLLRAHPWLPVALKTKAMAFNWSASNWSPWPSPASVTLSSPHSPLLQVSPSSFPGLVFTDHRWTRGPLYTCIF